MDLSSFRTLGRSGLLVSPLALGAMTFGAPRWGSGETASRAVFDAYVEAGGNFIDTADVYSGGRSEEMVGAFVGDASLRDRVVIATKSGFPRGRETPLSGGNGAKNIRMGLDGSLKRLNTDYVDLYWIHVWDQTTPPEEVLTTLASAVQAGKILYYGFSNTPGWYVARVATLAQAHGLPLPVGLQYSYSLIDRGVELDILPAGNALGLGLVPWSPLGAGMLTGKYGREWLTQAGPNGSLPNSAGEGGDGQSDEKGRLSGDNPFGGMLFTERNFAVVDALRAVAGEIGAPMAQVALHWVATRPGVSSTLIGASRPEQMRENIRALDLTLTPEQLARLDEASALPTLNPYFIFDMPRARIFGGHSVEPWAAR